ncbi:MAG: DUF4897 domain-containing protein [Haloplanus sp.]
MTALAVVMILSTAVSGIGAVASSSSPAAAQLAAEPLHQQSIETDSVRLIVTVHENGSAEWAVQYWTRLDDENTTAAFESLRNDIEANPSNYSDRFASRMRSTVRTAENATGREMNATDFRVSAEMRTPPQYGVVSYTFRWEGFAAVDDETIRVGDAIEGLFLSDRTRLVVQWPTEYTATTIRPTPDERRPDAVIWRGAETSFVSGEPRVVLRPAAAVTPTAGGTDGTATATPEGGPSPLLLLGLGLLFALVVAAAWRYRDRLGAGSRGPTGGTTGDHGEGTETVDEGGTGTTASSGGDSEERAEGEAASREDLLSNEERVLQFVREQGGRVKQQEIVEAFDWTEARTSQIVRDLRDEGDLEGFRLGRENVLKLPDEE